MTDSYDTFYFYDSENNLIALQQNGTVAYFHYNSNGEVTSMTFDETKYFFIKNQQGDVEKIVDRMGNVQVSYTYDAWGKVLSVDDDSFYTISQFNPFGYRGYVYDSETGLYYLQSRYYDPQTGRFLNADIYCDTDTGTPLSTNMFAYCENNCVNRIDPIGKKAINITTKLVATMYTNALYLYSLAKLAKWCGRAGKLALLYKFYTLVKTNGKWDLKNQDKWKLKNGDYYKFMGVRISVADLGNIHFGFVGAVIFSWKTLCVGAGIYQIYSGTSSWKFWYSFFDDPRDTFCISLGYAMWKVMFRKRVFSW